MSVEDAASPTQKTTHSDAPEQKDVLRIIAEVERSLGALRARADQGSSHADTQKLLVDEIERLKRETHTLADERARLLERQVALESQLASAHATRSVAEERARRAEDARARFEQETLNSQISRETEFIKSLEARAAADHARAEELERQCVEARQDLAVAMSKLTAVLKIAERHTLREAELEAEAESLRAEVEVARRLQREGHIILADGPQAESQINSTIMPRLTQVANFLRIRKQRLHGLHFALKRRAKALRVLRQLYQAQPAILAEEAEAVRSAREALEQDRTELEQARVLFEEKKAVIDAAEQRIAKGRHRVERVTGVARIALFFTLAVGFLAGGAWLSWQIAVLMAPKDAIASVELETTTRGADAVPADAAPIVEWLKTMVQNEAFAGTVAGRLADRGYSRHDADALVAPLATALKVEHSGSSMLLTLTGKGVEQSVALLDAVVAVAISESARQPERKADQLRLTVLGAKAELGRTVLSRGMLMKDETHLIRAGLLFGMVVTLAGGAVVFAVLRSRRVTVENGAQGATTPAAAKPAAAK